MNYNNLKKKYTNSNFQNISDQLNEDGYAIIDLKLSKDIILSANNDIDKSIKEKYFKKNSPAFHYNENPRIVEAWKSSSAIKSIATNKTIIDILRYCYQSEPIPMSTINFLKGTEQPLHSDEFHYGSIPHRYLTGCWIALEDIHPDSGPLVIAKKSHKLPIFSLEQINVKIPKTEKEFKLTYTIYEEWVKEIIESNGLEIVTPRLNAGECLIWLSNTLHGAYKIKK